MVSTQPSASANRERGGKRITVLVALVRGVLKGDELCTQLLRSADYQVVLDSIEADAVQSEQAAMAVPLRGDVLKLLVRPIAAEASDALDQLRRWLAGAKRAIVCDPYFFSPPKNSSMFTSDADYAKRVLRLFDPDTKEIQVFCNGYSARMKTLIWRPLKDGRRVQVFDSPIIHDRFIIKDNREGKMIGASMQGFGGKIFAVLDLPWDDIAELLKSLRQIAETSPKPWA